MRSFLVTLAATAALVAAQLRIETPTNLVVCQPALLAWEGGSKPYFVAVIPGGEPTGAALKDFGQTDDNSRTWNVDLPAGQSVSLRITDSTGAINYSEKVTIREGSSTSCLNGASASGSSAASGAAVSASSAASGAASSAGGAVSSVSSAAASATGAARSAASSGTAAAGTAASRASSAAGGAASNATSAGGAAASAASASVRPSNAASFGAKVQTAGVFGAVAAIFGVALF